MIGTVFVLLGIVVIFGFMYIHLIRKYSKTKSKPCLYMSLFSLFIVLPAFFGILVAAVFVVNDLTLATLFYRASTTSGMLATVFLNTFSITITNSKKRNIWIPIISFAIIMFIIWNPTFEPIVEGHVDGTIEFTLMSTYKEPYGLPLIETIVTLMAVMTCHPIYSFFRSVKNSKERIVKIKSLLMGVGLFVTIAAYSIEVTGAISHLYMPIYRPTVLIGALTLFLGYEMPKWLERKLVRQVFVGEKTKSPLEEFFAQPIAPSTRSPLHAFSEPLGLKHEQMAGRKILFEFNPASNYEKVIQDFAAEALANAEQLVIFTRRGSSIHSSLREYKDVKLFCFTQQFSIPKESTENEILLPSGDTSLILDVLDKALKANPGGPVNVIFDNLSDLLLSTGFDKTYRFVRYAVEMLASPKNTVIFLLNQTAHDPNVTSSLKGLFSDQVFCGERGLQIIKLHDVYQTY